MRALASISGFAYALHGIEERGEEHQGDRQRHLRPQAQPQPQHENRGQHHAEKPLMKGSRMRAERIEAEPDAAGHTGRCR